MSEYLKCGHHASLAILSAETGEFLHCDLCDTRSARRDAEMMEATLRAELAELKANPPQVAGSPVPEPKALPEVTDEMVAAYLEANDRYWRETDALPATNPSKWRQGTPREATRVSLRAALAAAPRTASVQPLSEERIAELVEVAWDEAEEETQMGECVETEWERFGLRVARWIEAEHGITAIGAKEMTNG